ncbi:MAG: O-antigen ligase family protein [Chthoniobacteraceae bacterium]
MGTLKNKAALGIFALLVVSAPLLFGAVDRQVQLSLTLFMGVGLLLVPPVLPALTIWGRRLLGLWIAFILFKEFAPSAWFGATKWHSVLSQDYGLALPWTHNPEPGRVIDALLVMVIGIAWFFWVRTLAAENDNRLKLVWILFGSAAVLAVVCLAIHPANPKAIYGIRFTPGWTGYGPFPNRNHTACFLAMGTLLGCGCLTVAIRHKQQLQAVLSFVFLLLIFVALLASKSRGGLLACVIGLGIYATLVVFKLRNRKAFILVGTGMLVFVILFLAFGASVAARFHGAEESQISVDFRWGVWANTYVMWKDAPLFGHGLGTFAQIFPLYQNLKLENQIVLHPESSWMLWLAEIGLIPLLVCIAVGAVFLSKNVRLAFEKRQGFFLRAAGFAAFFVIVFHSVWDVPAHRWAVAGYALAILAVSCPPSSRGEKIILKGKASLIPFAIAAFWMLPYYTSFPAWSPTFLTKLLSQEESMVGVAPVQRELRYFPLSPSLHEILGMSLLGDLKDTQGAWGEFRIADKLVPSSWPLAASQAVAARPFSPGMSLYYWSLAIERAGHRSEEMFYMAREHTANLPAAAGFWNSYLENNPELLLSYPQGTPDADARYYYELWWKARAFNDDIKEFEIQNFYKHAAQYGSLANLNEWMKRHPEREKTDYKAWATLLHYWKDDATAWKLLAAHTKEPGYPSGNPATPQDQMESTWFADPANVLNAQMLAQAYTTQGKADKAGEVILAIAAQDTAPPWFLQKGAYIQASQNHYSEAVSTLLRDRN